MRQRKVNKSTGGITLPPPSDPMKCTPTLGRGLTPGGDICLGVASRLQSPKSEWAKVSMHGLRRNCFNYKTWPWLLEKNMTEV